ncbi:MAG: hypothetical protein JJD96_04065 [Thermoleophilia bacterium]|nr:hypothetical protein [Thermoleophilia bacterium]
MDITCYLSTGFTDPARAVGGQEEMLKQFHTVRDEIRSRMREFFSSELNLPQEKG